MTGPSIETRCSLRSRAAEEPLGGTASTIRRWLLIEHPGPWGRDGLVDARLPTGVGGRLRELERRTASRVLLIRKPDRRSEYDDGRIICFAVDTREAWLGFRVLSGIQEAPLLDPRRRDAFSDPEGEPVFVTCTHGRRDPCCAERGRPLAEAVGAVAGDVSWESTHVGGDRFAGNLVAFPHGLYFGRVEPHEGPAIVRAYADGRIGRLDRYRGRSAHAFHVQAADVGLRLHLGLDRVGDAVPAASRRDGDRAEVDFAVPAGSFRVRLERATGEPMRLTCHSAREEAALRWRVADVRSIDR